MAGVAQGGLTAGPNPVGNKAGAINFFRSGAPISNATLYVYDASGNTIRKIPISDKLTSNYNKRVVGEWDLRDRKGRPVSSGTYLVNGTVKVKNGKREKVSLVVGIR